MKDRKVFFSLNDVSFNLLVTHKSKYSGIFHLIFVTTYLAQRKRNVYNGGGYVTEVKREASDSPWKQMTSQAAQMTNKQRVDPYSKVVLTEGSEPRPQDFWRWFFCFSP